MYLVIAVRLSRLETEAKLINSNKDRYRGRNDKLIKQINKHISKAPWDHPWGWGAAIPRSRSTGRGR